MGNSCCKDGAQPNVVVNPTASQHAHRPRPQNEEAIAANSPYINVVSNNVNQRFSQFFDIIRDKQAGSGIRLTAAYQSKISKEEIDRKRAEYWETRIEGNNEIWQAIRSACESDDETAMAILTAVGVKLVNKNLQQAYDSQGNRYDVPIFCINDPIRYNLPKKKQLKKEDLSAETMHIKIRRAGFAHDVELEIPKNATSIELKERYLDKVNEEGLLINKLRMFYGGKELVDASLLAEYGVQGEHVVQVFVRK